MRHLVLIAVCLASAAAIAADTGSKPQTAASKAMSVQLKPTQGNAVTGTLKLATDKSGVRISGLVEGFEPNSEHGFHVHEKGDCSAPDASSAGPHFNPTSQPHGDPTAGHARHVGDMMNLKADAKGAAKVDILVDGATLHTGQPSDLMGRAIVVHAQPDDYATQPSGNSGGRIACGVIAGH